MKKSKITFILFVLFIFPFSTNAQEKWLGNWSGKIKLPTGELEMIFKITKSDSGLVANLDVPLQGAKDLPVKEVIVNSDSITLKIPMIMGTYEGVLVSSDSISGKWKQGIALDLNLKKLEKLPDLNRPQTPKPPFSYLVEEVEYTNPASGFKIAGTLTFPKESKNNPVVILISGSGAQDRDETLFEHKPFWVIADFLTNNGIAVLRVDDRGVGGSEGNISEATSEDFAGDVQAGINYLKSRNEINASQIGLIGHSEGGLIAPIVATQTKDVAFFIMLAGPGIVGEEILYEQGKLLNKAAGMTDEQAAQNTRLQETIFDIILNEKDSARQIERLQGAYSGGMYPIWPDERKAAVDARINSVNSAWFRYFLTYDPYPTLTKVKCPVLSIIGEKDLQVPAESNTQAIKKALTKAGNQNFKTLKIDNLNHLFQNCETGGMQEYSQIEETFSVEVLEIMRDWIHGLNTK